MTWREFMQWAAWARHQPISDERCFDLGPAMIRKTLVDINSPRDSSSSLEDFLPFTWKDPNFTDIDRAVIAWARKQGASDDPG